MMLGLSLPRLSDNRRMPQIPFHSILLLSACLLSLVDSVHDQLSRCACGGNVWKDEAFVPASKGLECVYMVID